jgi:PIN domain nuclease of toxin-antitoxin system
VRVLLDTNAFLRWTTQTPLPRVAERLLARSDTESVVSIVTGWEIALKPTLALRLADAEAAIKAMGADLLPIRFEHLDELSKLPVRQDHRDPFDRMLIAQALAEELPIVSGDTRFTGYKRLRVIWD